MWYQNAWFFSVRGLLMKKSLKRSFCFSLGGKVDSQWLSFKLSIPQEKFLTKETLLCLSYHFVLFLDCFEANEYPLEILCFRRKMLMKEKSKNTLGYSLQILLLICYLFFFFHTIARQISRLKFSWGMLNLK